MIFTKDDTYTIDEQVEKLTRESNFKYRACIGSLIYLFSIRVGLSFVVHKLAKFLSNYGRVKFEEMVHLLRYIRENNNLGLKYHANMKNAHLSDLLRQTSIKPENQLMVFSDSSWQDFPDTGRSTGAYIIFYQGVPIDHVTHVPVSVSQSIA